jgi:hypothetical protein
MTNFRPQFLNWDHFSQYPSALIERDLSLATTPSPPWDGPLRLRLGRVFKCEPSSRKGKSSFLKSGHSWDTSGL